VLNIIVEWAVVEKVRINSIITIFKITLPPARLD
jgi:hypothetical protein